MPVKIPNKLPATSVLQRENIFVMTEDRASTQDIRPLHIAILNLMPTKEVTETQLLRVLGNTPLQIEVTLLRMASHTSKNTSEEHLREFYTTYEKVQTQKFDGVIITGAPVELLPFEEVNYWTEMTHLMSWARKNAYSTLHICWAAQAGLYYHYGIPKYPLKSKQSGVYAHKVSNSMSKLIRGFDDVFYAPHSRYTTTRREDVEKIDALEILAESDEAGLYLVASRDGRQVFVTGHSEYDPDTLENEYKRDINKGMDIAVPAHYFEDDDPNKRPVVTWRSHANLLFQNWLNYCVYQETPYDISKI